MSERCLRSRHASSIAFPGQAEQVPDSLSQVQGSSGTFTYSAGDNDLVSPFKKYINNIITNKTILDDN